MVLDKLETMKNPDKYLSQQCKEYFNEYTENKNRAKRYNKKAAISFLIGIAISFIILICMILFDAVSSMYLPAIFLTATASIISMLAGLVTALVFLKKKDNADLNGKEAIVFHLCNIANFVSAFINSEVHTNHMKNAIKANKRLISDLDPMEGYGSLYKNRGFEHDKKIIEFVNLLKLAANSYFKKTLEDKIKQQRLKEFVLELRTLAWMLENENECIDKGIAYLKNNLKIKIPENKEHLDFIKSVLKDTGIWILSAAIAFAFLWVLSLFLMKAEVIISWKDNGWAVLTAIASLFFIIPKIKEFIDDKIKQFQDRKSKKNQK